MGSAIRAGYGMGSVVTHVSTYCQLPVSQASLLIELSGALAVGGALVVLEWLLFFVTALEHIPPAPRLQL